MSIGICGSIKSLNNNINDKIEMAYDIHRIALELRIGCKLGGNVSRHVYEIYSKNSNNSAILFELMESPIDTYLDDLFFPKINGELINYENEFSKIINGSLSILYNMLKLILENKSVECIYLDFNYLFVHNEKIVDVKINFLSEYILSKYIEEGYFAPVIRMRVIR